MIRVGIIGYGYAAATFHLPFIRTVQAFELRAICSSKAETLGEQCPGVDLYRESGELIRNPEIDLVVITTPNNSHYGLVKAALLAGKHVLVEKPMVTRSAEALELASLASHLGLQLAVFHNRRWDGDFLTVQELIAQGVVGELRTFESHFDRFRPVPRQRWREQAGEGAGIWFDLGTHLVDQAVYLFGLPEAVSSRCLEFRPGSQATDYFHVILHYPQLEAILHGSPFVASPTCRFQLGGTEATYVKYGLDPQEDQLKAGILPDAPEFGRETAEQYGLLYGDGWSRAIETHKGRYQEFFHQMAAAIQNGTAVPVDGFTATEGLKVLEAAVQSSRTGTTVAVV